MPVHHFLGLYSLDKENRLLDFDFVFPNWVFCGKCLPLKNIRMRLNPKSLRTESSFVEYLLGSTLLTPQAFGKCTCLTSPVFLKFQVQFRELITAWEVCKALFWSSVTCVPPLTCKAKNNLPQKTQPGGSRQSWNSMYLSLLTEKYFLCLRAGYKVFVSMCLCPCDLRILPEWSVIKIALKETLPHGGHFPSTIIFAQSP